MLGMYVHTHWGYNRPYSARTWSVADWEGYLSGIEALGYDLVMVWPQFDAMAPVPNQSDRDHMRVLSAAIDLAHERFGMKMVIVAAANTIGSDRAAEWPFETRPYFVVETRVNPKDEVAVAAFLEGRRNQFGLLANADALAIIDSDPGGYIGSTNDEFVDLACAQAEAFRSFNPSAEFIYWMLAGWESYNHFWEKAAVDEDGETHMWEDWKGNDFPETLELLKQCMPEPWWLYAWLPQHLDAVRDASLTPKAMYYPYGLVEGEPTFPMTNCNANAIADGLPAEALARCPVGVMANAQTHCLQLPHTYLFAHFAGCGTPETGDLAAFADRLLPGLEETVADGWRAIDSREPDAQRACAEALRRSLGQEHEETDLSGLLFADADTFLEDLAMNLDLRAALVELKGADDVPSALSLVLRHLRRYQGRVGFVDAYGGPLADALHPELSRLDDPGLNAVLRQSNDWRDPSVRNGIVPRLLDAIERYCREKGTPCR